MLQWTVTETKSKQLSSIRIWTLIVMMMMITAQTMIVKAMMTSTIISMQVLRKLNLCFEDISLLLLFSIQSQRSSTFFLSRSCSFISRKKTIALESKQCRYLRSIYYNNLLSTRKTFVIEREKNSLLCLVDHLLFMILHDDVFVIESTRNVSYIFQVKSSAVKKSLTLKIKVNALNQSVFRESERVANEYRTSKTKSLHSSTWLHYLKRLDLKSSLKHFFTQYVAQRDLVNVINSKSSSSHLLLSSILICRRQCWCQMIDTDKTFSFVRDQIFDHQLNAVRYYLDRKIQFNTQTVFLDRSFNKIVQKLVRLMTLTVDFSVLIELFDELSKKLANSKQVIHLSSKSKRLIVKIRIKYELMKHASRKNSWVKKKKDVDAVLHHEKTNHWSRMIDKVRKQHFRNVDTDTLEAQFADIAISASVKDIELTRSLKYNISKWDVVIRLICESVINLTDHKKHVRSIKIIKVRAALCRQQESQRQDRLRSTFKSKKLMNSEENTTDYFLLICRSIQFSFCLDEKCKFYENQTFEYCKLNKMMKHVQKMHLRKYASNDEINCKHLTCKINSLTLSSVMTFKHHIVKMHQINLHVQFLDVFLSLRNVVESFSRESSE